MVAPERVREDQRVTLLHFGSTHRQGAPDLSIPDQELRYDTEFEPFREPQVHVEIMHPLVGRVVAHLLEALPAALLRCAIRWSVGQRHGENTARPEGGFSGFSGRLDAPELEWSLWSRRLRARCVSVLETVVDRNQPWPWGVDFPHLARELRDPQLSVITIQQRVLLGGDRPITFISKCR